MTLAELIQAYRVASGDLAVPPFFEDPDLAVFFNEAVRQACVRARLIHESDDPDICTIPVLADTATYPLHAALYELDYSAFLPDGETRKRPISLVSQDWLSAHMDDWRDEVGTPEYAIQLDTSIRLVPRPDRAGTFFMEGYRTPKAEMAESDDTPEINALHHNQLVHWVLFRVLSIPDSELLDLEKAQRAEAAFTRYFGPMPDADLRRITREDVPQAVVSFMP